LARASRSAVFAAKNTHHVVPHDETVPVTQPDAERDALLERLLALRSFDGVSDSDAVDMLGQLVDAAFYAKSQTGLRHAVGLGRGLVRRTLPPVLSSRLDYTIANAWDELNTLMRRGKPDQWDAAPKELRKASLHLRRSVASAGFVELQPMARSQALTNLANLYSHVGRFVAAPWLFRRAATECPKFGMPVGNEGFGLLAYGGALYDPGHQAVFLWRSHTLLSAAIAMPLEPGAGEFFAHHCERIEKAVRPGSLATPPELEKFSLGRSKREKAYRRWCLATGLFLNPLNDLGPYPIAARDVLHLPAIVTRLDAGPGLHGFFNELKQEYATARYMLYEAEDVLARPHFSDRGVGLWNTLDYPQYGLRVSKMRIAFRLAYSIMDKVAVFLSEYLALGVPRRDVALRRLWYKGGDRKNGLRSEFSQRPNWPLRGLYWLSQDLYEEEPEHRDVLDEEARDLANIRNALEHGYLKIVDFRVPAADQPGELARALDAMRDKHAHMIVDAADFEKKAEHLLRLAREALIYASLGVHVEEQLRATRRHSDERLGWTPLFAYEDNWKR
jgi:HEPN superfamily protein